MRKLISLFLITTLITNIAGTAYASTWWDAYMLATGWNPQSAIYVLNPITWALTEFINATLWLMEYVGDLEEIVNWSYPMTKSSLAETGASYILYLHTVDAGAEELKLYALARAQSIYVQELANGTPAEATEMALNAVDEMYDNKIKELIDHQNITVLFLKDALPHYKQVCDVNGVSYDISLTFTDYGSSCGELDSASSDVGSHEGYYYKKLTMKPCDFEWHKTVKYIILDDIKIYDYDYFKSVLSKLKNDRQWVYDNLVVYFTQINQLVESGQLNLSEVAGKVLDPYAILTMAKNDTANYYAWAMYQLALAGLLTNYTAPITIEVNGTQYNGYLFASDGFNTTLTVNHTYTIPEGESVYLVTPDGILVLEPGDTFKLLSAVDEKTGEPLPTIILTRYVDDSLEVQEFLEDVERLLELYNQTLQKITTMGGGDDGNSWADYINDFWNSLDLEVKALIIGGGVLVAIILIGRSFGRGGVSVIRMEK